MADFGFSALKWPAPRTAVIDVDGKKVAATITSPSVQNPALALLESYEEGAYERVRRALGIIAMNN